MITHAALQRIIRHAAFAKQHCIAPLLGSLVALKKVRLSAIRLPLSALLMPPAPRPTPHAPAPRLPPHAPKLALTTIVTVYHDNEQDDNRTYDTEPVSRKPRKTLQNKLFRDELLAAIVDVS